MPLCNVKLSDQQGFEILGAMGRSLRRAINLVLERKGSEVYIELRVCDVMRLCWGRFGETSGLGLLVSEPNRGSLLVAAVSSVGRQANFGQLLWCCFPEPDQKSLVVFVSHLLCKSREDAGIFEDF